METSPSKMQPISSVKSKEQGKIIGNESKKVEERIRFDVFEPDELRLRFGSGITFKDISEYTERIFNSILKVKGVQVSTFDFADVVYSFGVRYKGNHDTLLIKIYHKGSILEGIFEESSITSGDVNISGWASKEKKNQCGIFINGSTTLDESLNEKYEAGKDLNITIGFAQYGVISRDNIGSLMVTLFEDAQNYVLSNILGKVVKPLDDEISSFGGE